MGPKDENQTQKQQEANRHCLEDVYDLIKPDIGPAHSVEPEGRKDGIFHKEKQRQRPQHLAEIYPMDLSVKTQIESEIKR